MIVASELYLSNQIGKHLDKDEVAVLDHLADEIAAHGTAIAESEVEHFAFQKHQNDRSNWDTPFSSVRDLYGKMLEYGLQCYSTELDRYDNMAREDFADRFGEVSIMSRNTDGSKTAIGINKLKRKRLEGWQHIDEEDLPGKSHYFDDVDLSNLFTIDSHHMAKKRKLARAYINIFKYSFEFDSKNDPVQHVNPSNIADAFYDVMTESRAFKAYSSKEQFLRDMQRENILLDTAQQCVLKERERIRQHDTQSEWKAMVREEIGEVFEFFEEQKVHHLRMAKAFSHLCRAEVVTRKFRKTGQRAIDAPQKARQLNGEMISHWKGYEKDLAERRKKKEREEQERRKKEQEMEEARRQQKKLNFLLSQTELYSHFMARKVAQMPSDTELLSSNLNELAGKDRDGLTVENAFKKAERAFSAQRDATSIFDKESGQLRGDKEEEPIHAAGDEQITEPQMFKGKLKKYQLKGLNWLASLYDQGINGILADEMGLGKTIQTIAFLAYLAEVKNIWGPFLVIVPSSTLHNWQQELQQFCPDLRVLPYWGNVKERRILRKYWNPQKLYKKNSPFHVLVTSYNLILEDDKMFNKIKWQYLILDEAHAIKSSKSARWNTLLRFQCRNRMLLTGTPIQNTMAELWALLHFIMPSLFDSHDEFDEWFSKDIESHAEQKGKLNEQQLARLHMILKPFMLRRVKKDVESEMPPKTEYTVQCSMSKQQQVLYRQLKRQLTIPQNIKQATSSLTSNTTLMNYVMQFRKACNHPDLFGQVGFTEPLQWQQPSGAQMPLLSADILGHHPIVFCTNNNPIELQIPRIVADDLTDDLADKQRMLQRRFHIFDPYYMQRSNFDNLEKQTDFSTFSFARFTGRSLSELAAMFNGSMLDRFNALLQHGEHTRSLHYIADGFDENAGMQQRVFNQVKFLIAEMFSCTSPIHTNSLHVHPDSRHMWEELIVTNPSTRYTNARPLIEEVNTFQEKVLAPPITIHSSSRRFAYKQHDIMYSPHIANAIEGFSVRSLPEKSKSHSQVVGMAAEYRKIFSACQIHPPDISKLIADSGKLQALDQLLKRLYRDGHRVLIFSQMTKMLDILEDYLYARRYKFFRLDGQTPIGDRRDMVATFQRDKSVFCFLLSTRAGGLGINLTAADTVVFYDSDWNPTMGKCSSLILLHFSCNF